jgi:hypothetical protein
LEKILLFPGGGESAVVTCRGKEIMKKWKRGKKENLKGGRKMYFSE